MNQAYSRLSTTHGHITDCKLDSVVYAGVCVVICELMSFTTINVSWINPYQAVFGQVSGNQIMNDERNKLHEKTDDASQILYKSIRELHLRLVIKHNYHDTYKMLNL